MTEIEETEGFELSPLEQNALDRRKRLENLRKMALEKRKNNEDDGQPLMLLNPRSYSTVTAGVAEIDDSVKQILRKTEGEIQDIIEEAQNISLGDNLDITTLAPKKVDWDLKRGIQHDLDKLKRKTDEAIVKLVRQRIKKESELDLAKTLDLIQEKEGYE